MGGAFEWLNKIFEYLWAFIPRPYHVINTHRGVRYRRGKKPVLVEPGVRWYWPLTTTVKIINVTLRADEFESHVYTTRDGKSVALGYTMLSQVKNPVKADSSTDNFVQTIGELGESVLSPIVASKTFQELLDELASGDVGAATILNARLTREAHKMARRFGVNVEYCRIHTFSTVRVIKLLEKVVPSSM